MPTTINILTDKPTFDLTEWGATSRFRGKVISCQTTQVFKFDKCKGTIMARSRILRPETKESRYVESVISAVIDAGFVGKLVFKIRLTGIGLAFLKRVARENSSDLEPDLEARILAMRTLLDLVKDSVQIDLNPFPNNYYDGTNQTDLTPDVIFTAE